jgi:hypothetical protein
MPLGMLIPVENIVVEIMYSSNKELRVQERPFSERI